MGEMRKLKQVGLLIELLDHEEGTKGQNGAARRGNGIVHRSEGKNTTTKQII